MELSEAGELQAQQLAAQQRLCERLRQLEPAQPERAAGCPSVWDGILCWPRAGPGLSAQPCPAFILGFDPQETATRHCLQTGQWFVHADLGQPWTNYSRCYSAPEATIMVAVPRANASELEMFVPAVKAVSRTGYAVSLAALLIAFCILATVKRLRCPRNTLHMHLFLSFIMRAFMALLKDSLFVLGLGLASDIVYRREGAYFGSEDEENWECKLITSLWQYFIMANYSWILMEGLYLHNLIFLALFSDTSAITLYVTLGWGLPAVFVGAWVASRALLDDFMCWTVHRRPGLFLLVRLPTAASILLSFALFLNIVRVLLLKLRSSVCEETKRYRRWAKSTLVLVPLFGVHYALFLGLSYSDDPQVVLAYLFCDQLFGSFQGFFVAVLYCFLNGEVRSELGRRWRRAWRGACRGALGGRGRALGLAAAAAGPGAAAGAALAIFSDGKLGAAGRTLSQTGSRHSLPRASCYSSTSCTSLSVLGGAGWPGPGQRRGGGGADPGPGLSCHSGLAELAGPGGLSNQSELGSRRWSPRGSDGSVGGGSALEMRSLGPP